jgi:hydrogenase small subunit
VLWSEGGVETTALGAVRDLSARSVATLSIGSCASFGGVAAASPNPMGVMSVGKATGRKTIAIPGCPPHPDWIVWCLARLLAGDALALDGAGRPIQLFKGKQKNVHERCPRKEAEEASDFGSDGLCLESLGCKGDDTQGDCPVRLWNNRTNWCVGANAICIGCTRRGFPDQCSPFFSPGEGD